MKKKPTKKSIVDFFDIGNYDHLKALRCYLDTWAWPEGFIPKDVDQSPAWWFMVIEAKMADMYLNTTLRAMEFGKKQEEPWELSKS